MDYSDLQSRIAEMLGLPDDDTEFTNKIKSWINESYKAVSIIEQWPWLVTNDIIQTNTEITTGTVDVTNASAAITFSSAPSVSVATDWRIQFAGAEDWYDISAHTAAAAGATLADNFLGTTNTTSEYTLRRVYYSLPSDFGRLVSVRQAITNIKLQPVDTRLFDARLPDPTSVASPRHYLIVGQDASQNYRIVFYPTPNDEINIDLRYYKKVTALSANSDEPLIPDQFRPLIVFDVLMRYGYLFLDDTRISQATSLRSQFLEEMRRGASPIKDETVRKLPWDKAQPGTPRIHRLGFDLPIEE